MGASGSRNTLPELGAPSKPTNSSNPKTADGGWCKIHIGIEIAIMFVNCGDTKATSTMCYFIEGSGIFSRSKDKN